jgi:hypothetical protein
MPQSSPVIRDYIYLTTARPISENPAFPVVIMVDETAACYSITPVRVV